MRGALFGISAQTVYLIGIVIYPIVMTSKRRYYNWASGNQENREAPMDAIQSRGRIIAGVSYDIPGMGYRNPQTGLIEGFEADLARAIAATLLGAPDRVEFRPVTDAGRIPLLQSDQLDMVLSQLTITPDREEQVDFSIPYWVTREALLVPMGSSIKGFEDLKGKRITAVAGSVSIRRMKAALPDEKLVETRLSADCLEVIAKGEADAASNDLINLTMLQRASDNPDAYRIIDIGDHFDEKPFGVAVKKGRRSLVDLLNTAITTLKAKGEIDRLLNENIASVSAAADLSRG
jgi:ABC-type amino acid transport substrate-binding protein